MVTHKLHVIVKFNQIGDGSDIIGSNSVVIGTKEAMVKVVPLDNGCFGNIGCSKSSNNLSKIY